MADLSENDRETRDRAQAVARILERLDEELFRLELVPTDDPYQANALSAAKGYVRRARACLVARWPE